LGLEFGLVNYTTQKIWENRTVMISAFELNGSRIKPFRKPGVCKALRSWLKQQRIDDVSVSASVVMINFVLIEFKFLFSVIFSANLFQIF
jgi:hypothetical protein